MPFGLSTATHVLTRITKPICIYITRHGIRHTIFIDDGKINAADKETLIWAFRFVLDTLEKAGFVVSRKKTDTQLLISQCKVYLGFSVDLLSMSVSAKPHKLNAIQSAIVRALDTKPHVEARIVASVIGKIIALEPALGPIVQLLSRAAQMDLAEAVEERGWKAKVTFSSMARHSLSLFLDNMEDFNGAAIKSTVNATPLKAILQDCDKETPLHGRHNWSEIAVAAGDASDKAVCAFGVRGIPDLFLQVKFNEQERGLSSGHRELLTIKYALQERKTLFRDLPSKSVLWLTDSPNMTAFLTKGSTKRHIMPDILEVYKLARSLDLRLIPVQISREDYRIQEADHGTRFFDPDDWAVDFPSFQRLTEKRSWTVTVGLFSHYSNKKCDKFYSFGRAPHTSGVDAFSQSWNNEVAWVCPPTSLVIQAIRKIGVSRMRAILVVPAWPSSIFWSFLFPDGERAQRMTKDLVMFRTFVLRGQYCDNKLMQGHTKFPFLAFFL